MYKEPSCISEARYERDLLTELIKKRKTGDSVSAREAIDKYNKYITEQLNIINPFES